jgi:cell division protease FtsH
MLMGGRIAEEITTVGMTTGAGNDLERTTELARRMVCEWGMSEAVGPLTFGKKAAPIFLGRDFAQHQDYSEHTALRIDQEIERIVAGAAAEGSSPASIAASCFPVRSTTSRCLPVVCSS